MAGLLNTSASNSQGFWYLMAASKKWGFVLLLFFFAGCSVPSMEARRQKAGQIAGAAGWTTKIFTTDLFDIVGFEPGINSGQKRLLTIYIEGDGLAWMTRSKISPDPTPVDPLGLKLAMRHPDDAVLYLARPFQFGQTRNYSNRFWTFARFAPEVVGAYMQIFDRLKEQFGIHQFHLVGYSGGGALAALIATKRNDIALLLTLAGNLDHSAWTTLHQVSPLTESLNPADFWQGLVDIPQVHFYGEKDTIVPLAVVTAFCDRFPEKDRPQTRSVKNASHGKGWEASWPRLYLESIPH